MADLPKDVEAFLARLPDRQRGASVELLLERMPPERARLLCLAAIPHVFNEDILAILDPSLDRSAVKEACAEFSLLSMVIELPEGYAINDGPRTYLFQKWLHDGPDKTFLSASAGLAKYYYEFSRKTEANAQDDAIAEWIFHLFPVEREGALHEFEAQCRIKRYQWQFSEVETLVSLVREYDAILAGRDRAIIAYHEAKLAVDLNRLDEARTIFRAIIENDAAPDGYRTKSLIRLGGIEAKQHKWDEAIEYFQQALSTTESTAPPDDSVRARILFELGVAYRETKKFDGARNLLSESIVLAGNAGDNHLRATALNGRGLLYMQIGDQQQAISNYQESLDCLNEIGDRFRPAGVYNNLGSVYLELCDWDKSRDYYEKSLFITRDVQDLSGQAYALNNLARVEIASQNSDKAIIHLNDSVDLFSEAHDFYGAGVVTRNLGRIERRRGNIDSAREALQMSINYLSRIHSDDLLKSVEEDLRSLGKSR